jgi:UDP-GalNAc:undecaprenyl-phosphate GalNAc-1-phosphate transferase
MPLILATYSLWRLAFQTTYSLGAIGLMLWLAIGLQAGDAGVYLFLVHDVSTQPPRLAFILGFLVAYITSLLAFEYTLNLPRFDFLNRIIAINILTYSFFGLTLSALRLPLASREVFVIEFLISSSLLVINYVLVNRIFPRRIGVLGGIPLEPFQRHPALKATYIDPTHSFSKNFDIIVRDLRNPVDAATTHLLTTLAQQRIVVRDANSFIETLWGRIPLANLTLVDIESFTPPRFYIGIKRVGELVLIVTTLPLLVPLSLLIATAIKLTSPGKVIFRQQRTGLQGKSFTMLKFRSMVTDYDQRPRFAQEQDKRITRVGKVLRRLRLDELPQLWNVVRGDMSLIGPRPEQLHFTDHFDLLIPYYGFRHTTRPGITGWAQVMYGYAASDKQTRAKLEFDFYYIKHMSMWLDLLILFKTFLTIVRGTGAR